MTKTEKLDLLNRFVRSRIRREDAEALFGMEIRKLRHITSPSSSSEGGAPATSQEQYWIGMRGSSMTDLNRFIALNHGLSDEVVELIALYMAARSLDEV